MRPRPDTQAGTRLGPLVAEAWHTALPPWRTIAPTLLYCLRTLAAIALALYTAFALQLQSPLSSVITVLIVANPVTGALVSKSLWRLFGTFVGAAAAVLVMAAFAQSPMLFAIVFSLWIGLACIASTLLRFFKAYGAVLAGYTLIIVCAPAFDDPDGVFVSALSRLSAVSVGIAAAALVFLLTSVRPPSRLDAATLSLIRGTGATFAGHAVPPSFRQHDPAPGDTAEAADALGRRRWRSASPGSLPDAYYDQRGALLAQAGGLGEIIEYAAADSLEIARRSDRLRLGVAGLVGTLTTLHAFHGRLGAHQDLADDVRRATEALASLRLEAPEPALAPIAGLRDRLAAEAGQPADAALDLEQLGAREHVHDLLTRLHDAVRHLTRPLPGKPPPGGRAPGLRLRRFLDWPTALRNGTRGGIVTLLAFLFWYVTQWPSGPVLLTYLVPAACLLATNPSASRASIDFSQGTLLAIPASYVCESLMLPQITGFPLLIAALGCCLLPGIWLQFHPRHGLRAFGYVVFFNAMITVRNPITFDDIGLVNGWLGFVIGTAALIVVFRALLPSNPRLDADRLLHSITRAVARLGVAKLGTASLGKTRPSRTQPEPVAVWEHLQMQKALLLIQRLQPLPYALRQEVTDCAFVAIELGRDILRLRRLLADAVLEPPECEAILSVLSAIKRLRHDPREAASRAGQAATLLAAGSSIMSQAPDVRRIAALLQDIATLIETAPSFLERGYTVAPC